MEVSHVLENIENEFTELLKNPEVYIESQPEKTDNFKRLSKKSYSIAVNNNRKFKGRALSKLLVEGFDEEQIWQQSDLLNKSALSNISRIVHTIKPEYVTLAVSKFNRHNLLAPNKNKISDKIKDNNKSAYTDDFSDDDGAGKEYVFDDDSDSPIELKRDNRTESSLENELNSEEDYVSSSGEDYVSASEDDPDSSTELEKNSKKTTSQNKLNYKSEVDDKFFKLSQLEEFLRVEDIKAERGDESASEGEIDYFQDIPSEDSDDFEDETDVGAENFNKKSSRDLMHDDFFQHCESEEEDENENTMMDMDKTLISEDLNDSAENGPDEDENSNNDLEKISNEKNPKTPFELQQEKMRKEIQEYEKNRLKPLSWDLTGEVDAVNRPVNSLLDHEADFDSNRKQDLIIDKDLTEKVEEITIMAIRNKAYSDVERKVKPVEEVINYKKQVLDQTKSKKSLAEVYEEDYLKKQSKQVEEEEDPKHTEIKKLMDSLFPQMYALFSHIPKPAVPEIKIVSNLPAIAVEEVAPTSVSDVTLLAPEEVKKKSGLIKGKTERTDTDRKRERRKKKVHQKLKEKKNKEKLEALKANPSAKVSKLEKLETLKKLKQHKNTKIATIDDGGKIKSSKDFFSRLQDTVDTKNKTKGQVSNKKKKGK